MSVNDDQIDKAFELFEAADNLKGIREVIDLYGSMTPSNFVHIVISDVDRIDGLISELQKVKENLRPNENGSRQFYLFVNSAQNRVFYMDEVTKNAVVQAFQGTLSVLDDGTEQIFSDRLSELNTLVNG